MMNRMERKIFISRASVGVVVGIIVGQIMTVGLLAIFIMLGVSMLGKLYAQPMQYATLQWLDKVTARTHIFEIELNQSVHIGNLQVTLRHCDQAPPQETPESTAFLEVIEEKKPSLPRLLFSGWMFASQPAVNAMEHPVYDIWLVNCHMEPAQQLQQ